MRNHKLNADVAKSQMRFRNNKLYTDLIIYVGNNRKVLAVPIFNGTLKNKLRFLTHDKTIVAQNIININRFKNKVRNLRNSGTKAVVLVRDYYGEFKVGLDTIDGLITRYEEQNRWAASK